jgi:hypothetical protein
VKPGILDRLPTSVRRRVESCVEMHGNHTRASAMETHEHRPYLSRHWFLGIMLTGKYFAHLSEYIALLKVLLTSCIRQGLFVCRS